MSVVLFGDSYSVYTRSVRMGLHMKSAVYEFEEMDPFDPDQEETVRKVHPFKRVPSLQVDGFHLYETQAILDYVEALYPEPALRPGDSEGAARMRQVMSIADSYVYWPLVRQAAVQTVFNPLLGEPVDRAELEAGLEAAPLALDALETLAAEGRVLVSGEITLADCQLWPTMDYALMVPQIAEMVAGRPNMAAWVEAMRDHGAAKATQPDMEALAIDA